MFNFAPSGDLMQRLGIIPNQMQQGPMDGMPMQGQVPSMGGAMPGGLDLGIPTFLQQFQRKTQPVRPDIPTNGPSGMQNASAPPKTGLFGRFMGNMKQGGPAPSGKNFGAGGKMTGMMTNMAPMFGNMLLDDEERQKQALRSF